MSKYTECRNCGATIAKENIQCDRCNALLGTEEIKNAKIIFSKEARESGWHMGGLLKLIPTRINAVAYIGFCAGGVFGIDLNGKLIWSDDEWGYVSSVEYKNDKLYVNKQLVNVFTGNLV